MSEFVQYLLIITIFLGFLFALLCEYSIRVKDKDKEFTATIDNCSDNEKK
ncbi:hypothetical protein GKZ28_08405 [Clostridium chromiireducens]|jgi:hypothetical protein|uniref:Uncharacterized protein n=1 Tax=Clostridium chromiireducens TaxID=225345 RepID=A0A964RLE2_9CLOT|nr:hypothetical protein [Clostridium chromiireducens]MVX63716.1 hypothetical protein [Clostridium chromiireducens]